jgi:hypothetical protein
VRWVRLGEREVLRAIYFAVRAENWVTIVPTLEDLEIVAEVDSFRIGFHARHERGPVRFGWDGRITGRSDGRIEFTASGAAAGTFLRNRIGLCVLHPTEACAGRRCIVEHVDGDRAESVFPAYVAPHQPFRNVRAILHEVSPGVEAEVRMEGETFETEDQGNWGDASFKTYGTPLHLKFPVEVREGARVEQRASVSIFGITAEPVERAAATVPGALPKKRNSTEPVVVSWSAAEDLALPAIGLAGAERLTLSSADAERLRPLRLAHLRADIHLEREGWDEDLGRAAANAAALAAPLELALFMPEQAAEPLRRLAARLGELRPRVASFLVFAAEGGASTAPVLSAARNALAPAWRGIAFGGGADTNFAELNRNRLAPGVLDRVAIAFSPQVHMFDDATIVENLASPRRTAETLRSYSDGAPLTLSPVTLRPRRDSTPASWRAAGEAPFTDDPRQPTSFAAGWTLGLLAAAAEAGFAGLTLYELAGPRGVMDGGGAFPVLHALADVAGLPGARVARAKPRRPERVQALGLHSGGRARLFLANVTSDTHPVRVDGLTGAARRSRLGETGSGAESGLEVELGPHEVARLDFE